MADITVDVVTEDARWDGLGIEALALRAVTAALGHLPDTPWEVSLLACDDVRIATLNADFRGKAVPTNVLSWPSDERGAEVPGSDPAAPDPRDPELGDLAISFDTCQSEAQAGGIPLADHVTHLLVHGTLHLLGFDHEHDEDGDLMEARETAILSKLGIADPYHAE
ncbi:rRNA maturation RNase YbeY [Oceaniovalibus sp. ACAM 378]|uniref:rRNA maturation RNase YbeY n=1 Tax=Oceaniovalibus sp. ACAM 378 TaxID=2599923 RepID=UPI0011DA0242|nr:rRNA maturation RNase YbeY [Oceaniovalibus sp. ACAM 378]TYB87142.1 rRNA maturation RNase YbeY [Oceaniovalibus sp. ACAM 378]